MTRTVFRLPAAPAIVAFAVAVLPVAVPAQTAGFSTPPKLLREGTPAAPVPATGTVTLKVIVKSDGSIGAITVEKSTNHADDAAALEVAKTSTFQPASRDGKPVDGAYTLAVKFDASSVTGDTALGSADVEGAAVLLRAGKYAQAQKAMQAYLAAHPGDKPAQIVLGAADEYLGDYATATAYFDVSGPIPSYYRVVAAKAYADNAVDALKARDNDRAITLSEKSLALDQNVNGLYIQGTAYGNAQRYAQAIVVLEKAKAQAAAGKADAPTVNAIDAALVTTYLFGGEPARGLALAQAVKRRDPSNGRVDDAVASYYNQRALAAVTAGRRSEAVSILEDAAKAVPSRAVVLYVTAGNVLAHGERPDWKAVKAEADKALAIDPTDARPNYLAGVALGRLRDPNSVADTSAALAYLYRAKIATTGADAALSRDIEQAIAALTGAR